MSAMLSEYKQDKIVTKVGAQGPNLSSLVKVSGGKQIVTDGVKGGVIKPGPGVP